MTERNDRKENEMKIYGITNLKIAVFYSVVDANDFLEKYSGDIVDIQARSRGGNTTFVIIYKTYKDKE